MFSQEFTDQPDQPLVQTILEPLLDDFQYWFDETETLLTSPKADCLNTVDRRTLVEQLQLAKQEVATAKALMLATDGNAGVDIAVIRQWHQLVGKCWQTARHVRQQDQSDR